MAISGWIFIVAGGICTMAGQAAVGGILIFVGILMLLTKVEKIRKDNGA